MESQSHSEQIRAKRKKSVDEVTDSYAKDLLCRDGTIKRSDVTQELIEAKRDQVRMKRLSIAFKHVLKEIK